MTVLIRVDKIKILNNHADKEFHRSSFVSLISRTSLEKNIRQETVHNSGIYTKKSKIFRRGQ